MLRSPAAMAQATAHVSGASGYVRDDPAEHFRRWHRDANAEKRRVEALAASGVEDAALYERPGDAMQLSLPVSSNVLDAIVGLRALRAQREREKEASESEEEAGLASVGLGASGSEAVGPSAPAVLEAVEPQAEPVDPLVRAQARLCKAKRRPQFQAGLAQPLAPEAETDKLASVPIRERVHAVDTAWKTFLDGKAADWLQDGAVTNFELAAGVGVCAG